MEIFAKRCKVLSMETVYLKHGAEDIKGNRLNTMLEYTLIYIGITHSMVKNGYGKKIHVNNKYIEKLPRS